MIIGYTTPANCVSYCSPDMIDVNSFRNDNNIILLSGGIDSQAMISYFDNNDIQYTSYFFDYGHNQYDKHFAMQYDCNVLPLNLDILYFDMKVHEHYSRLCECTSPQLAIHLHGIDVLFERYPTCNIFMPGMPPFFNLNDDLTIGNSLPDFTQLSYNRYKIQSGNNLYAYFWDETDTGINMLHSPTQTNFKISDYQKKILLYTEAGLTIHPQEIKKTGFEEYKLYLKVNKEVHYDATFRAPISIEKSCIGVFDDTLLPSTLKTAITDWTTDDT